MAIFNNYVSLPEGSAGKWGNTTVSYDCAGIFRDEV